MKGISKILAAAVASLAILPAASQAASVVLSYVNIQTSTTPNFAAGTFSTYVPGTPITSGSSATYIRFGVRAVVANNANPAAASGYAPDADGDGTPDTIQPAQLGVGAFGAYTTNSTPSVLVPQIGGAGNVSTASVNSLFSSSKSPGVVAAGTGTVGTGDLANLIAGGFNSGSADAAAPTDVNALQIGTTGATPGTNSANNMFISLSFMIPANSPTTSASLAAIFPTTSFAFISNVTPGSPTVKPTYINRNFDPATDTLTGPGALAINVVGVPEPTSLAVLGIAGAGLMARRRKA